MTTKSGCARVMTWQEGKSEGHKRSANVSVRACVAWTPLCVMGRARLGAARVEQVQRRRHHALRTPKTHTHARVSVRFRFRILHECYAQRAFGPAKESGEQRECSTGSVRKVTPSICTSAVAWPSHVS